MKVINYSKLNPPHNIEKIKIKEVKKFGIKITKNLHENYTKISGDRSLIHTNKKFSIKNPIKLTYLEMTTSNVCNQTCVMCDSFFSTKWKFNWIW